MPDETPNKSSWMPPVKYFLPLFIFAALVATYYFAQKVFVECDWFGTCTPIKGELISRVIPDKPMVATCPTPKPDETVVRAEDRLDQMPCIIDKKEAAYAKEVLANATVAPAASPASATPANAISNKAKDDLVRTRTQLAQRYSQRMLFVVLSGVSFLLALGAALFSFYLIKEALAKTNGPIYLWIGLTSLVSIVASIVLFGRSEEMNVIVGPIFDQTIFANGDTNLKAVHLVNSAGFFATIWLASAANALFYAAFRLADAKTSATESAATDTNKKVVAKFEEFTDWLLYICAVMLCVGIVRLKVIAAWHLAIVSTDITDPFYKLLNDFFATSIGAQAAFYSIMLLAIYLPVKYAVNWLKPEPSGGVDRSDGQPEQQNVLQRLGVPLTGDMILKLFAVISPLFTGSVIDLVKHLLGTAA